MEYYLDTNRNSWNAKVEVHLKSDFYFVEDFISGKTSSDFALQSEKTFREIENRKKEKIS